MAEEASLSKSDLIAALKEAGIATKDDVRQIIGEEITARGLATKEDVRQIVGEEIAARGLATKSDVEDIVHNQLTEFHAKMTQPEINRLRQEVSLSYGEVRTGFKHLGEKLDRVSTEIAFVKDEIQGLKADLSNTPSRTDFEQLKRRVDRYVSKN